MNRPERRAIKKAVKSLAEVARARDWDPPMETQQLWARMIEALGDPRQMVVVVPLDGTAPEKLREMADELEAQEEVDVSGNGSG